MNISKPTPISPADFKSFMDVDNPDVISADKLGSAGVISALPLLPRSAFLKNKNTGVILPYSERLAQMRDIMVNCDINGNTDPAAWMPTVKAEGEYDEDMQSAALRIATNSIIGRKANDLVNMGRQNDPQERAMPMGAMPFVNAQSKPDSMTESSSAMIDIISSSMIDMIIAAL